MTLSEVRTTLSNLVRESQTRSIDPAMDGGWLRTRLGKLDDDLAVLTDMTSGDAPHVPFDVWDVTDETLSEPLREALVFYGFLLMPHERDLTG